MVHARGPHPDQTPPARLRDAGQRHAATRRGAPIPGHVPTSANLSARLTYKQATLRRPAAPRQVDTLAVRVSYAPRHHHPDDHVHQRRRPGPPRTQRQDPPPQNFWGSMQSQGAPNIQGDAYMTKYEHADRSATNASYDPRQYYQYGIDMPAGATNGRSGCSTPGSVTSTRRGHRRELDHRRRQRRLPRLPPISSSSTCTTPRARLRQRGRRGLVAFGNELPPEQLLRT